MGRTRIDIIVLASYYAIKDKAHQTQQKKAISFTEKNEKSKAGLLKTV